MLEEKNKLEKIEKIFNNLERQFKLAKSEFEEYKELVSLNREELNEKHPVFKEYDDKEFEHYVYVLSKSVLSSMLLINNSLDVRKELEEYLKN